MSKHRADKMRHRRARNSSIARLKASGIASFFRPMQVQSAGLTRDQLPALVRSGEVEAVARGLYRIADAELTENYSLAMACARVPNSVVCLLSALRVHELGTQAPHAVWLAIPHKARTPTLRDLQLRIVRFSGPAWDQGIQEREFEGVPGRITTVARTIVDCFRYERLMGPEIPMEALLDALDRRKVTIAELDEVSQSFPSRRLSAALSVYAT